MSEGNSSSGGIGISGLLGVVFVVLKLCGVIEWSWWWVTAPFWGGIALVMGAAVFCFGLASAVNALENRKK